MEPAKLQSGTMTERFRFRPLFFVFATLLILSAAAEESLQVRQGAPLSLSKQKSLSLVNLRGYGKVSGVSWRCAEGTILEIACEDAEKAKLTHSKYLSDLRSVPGIANQRSVAALRSGSKVFVLASRDEPGLQKLLKDGFIGDAKAAASSPEMEVPMWLDRWDQFGFRFYYRPWEKPKDASLAANYDFCKEFDFAEQSDHSGFVFWANLEQVDTAEGIPNDAWWDYAARAAAAKKLPAGLNLMLGGPGMSWFFNRYRTENIAKMPQYCGTYHSIADDHHGGSGFTSWNSGPAQDANLGILQSIINREAGRGNLTTILEPHGELKHGDYDIFVEYGPVADQTFRTFLRGRYKDLEILNKAWGTSYRSWDEVRVPEVASFLGWGPQAVDLSGPWKIAQEPGFDPKKKGASGAPTVPSQAPVEWFKPDFDDRSWSTVVAPGHDRTMFLPKQPAVYRRTIELPADWFRKCGKIWFYLWDLNTDWNQPVQIYLNGDKAAEDLCKHPTCHYLAAEVSSHLKAGKNQITVRVPSGYIAYRAYLSPDAPVPYPALGDQKNARWVDFVDWIGWSRVQAAQRGMEMIRQAQPGIQIDLMSPNGYADGIKTLAANYGGNFKNTGYMGAFWADDLPSQMRGADLPFSLEPGGPADDLPGFKKLMGRYQTEGIQGLDYFIHVGNILWDPEIRAHFEQTLKMTRLIGKYHVPKADLAFLWATRTKNLTGFPWGTDPNTNLPGAWNCKGVGEALLWRGWPRDGVSESDFANGNAAKYKVVIDTNTSILDEEMVRGIEQYVKGGGTFVTFVQTGRHTPTEPNSWPISRLTGYEVLSWDKPEKDGSAPGSPSQSLEPAPGQDVYPARETWMNRNMTGLRLKKTAAEAQDLLVWKDGTVAVGMRPWGKGRIIQLGCRDGGAVWLGLAPEAFEAILKWRSVARVPGHLVGEENGKRLLMRHSVTNNGLADVWSIWNQSADNAVEAGLAFDDQTLSGGIEVETGKPISFGPGKLSGLRFEPLQLRMFLTPRRSVEQAPLDWFELQRGWWRGTMPPPEKSLPPPPHRFSVDLSRDWAFRPLTEAEDGASFSAANTDDSQWDRVALGIWSLPDRREIKHAVLRKGFAVPKEWGVGDVELWLQAWHTGTFVDQGRVWLDGKLVRDWKADGLPGVNPDGVLQPGSRHALALEIQGKDALVGTRGACWLWCWPKPEATMDLAGEWTPSRDAMRYEDPVRLPGRYEALSLRRTVPIPAENAGKAVMIDITAEGPVLGVLINGKWVRRLHHLIGKRFQLHLTPWVKFGEDNEIELVQRGCAKGEIQAVDLKFFSPGQQYP